MSLSTYPKCPRCGNNEEDASIWNCGECGCVHCKECDPDNGNCPECGSSNMNQVGVIAADSGSDDDEDDLESDEYSECPRCGKNDDGASIWRCRQCGCVHCMDCDPDSGRCPNCGGGVKRIGSIVNSDD